MTFDLPWPDTDFVAIATIRKPIGLKGWCGVTACGETLATVRLPCALLTGRTIEAANRIILDAAVEQPKGFRCHFKGFDDRNCAEKLRDLTLFADCSQLPDLGEREYFHFELEGMIVESGIGGCVVGVVESVQNYPTVDAVEVRCADGRLVMIPLTHETVENVDREKRRITISSANCEELF
jgi:16S rRNA processing protein RimM